MRAPVATLPLVVEAKESVIGTRGAVTVTGIVSTVANPDMGSRIAPSVATAPIGPLRLCKDL
ncbi:unnamed protein product, partial [Closterium sp. NIES-65]